MFGERDCGLRWGRSDGEELLSGGGVVFEELFLFLEALEECYRFGSGGIPAKDSLERELESVLIGVLEVAGVLGEDAGGFDPGGVIESGECMERSAGDGKSDSAGLAIGGIE
jgi:hypothetical protein